MGSTWWKTLKRTVISVIYPLFCYRQSHRWTIALPDWNKVSTTTLPNHSVTTWKPGSPHYFNNAKCCRRFIWPIWQRKATPRPATGATLSQIANHTLWRRVYATSHGIYGGTNGQFGTYHRRLANKLLLSRTVFYRKLKSIVGLTPVDFIRDIRIKRAVQLIDSGRFNISQVAYMTGFNDPVFQQMLQETNGSDTNRI